MKLEPCEYSEPVAASLSVAMGSDVHFIEQQIAQNECQVWRFSCDDETLGYAITRQEIDEFVVVAYQGENVAEFGDYIVRVCELKNIPNARFHTMRPGLIKLLAALNPEPLEYVVRIPCHGR